ncbi:MAG: leucine-rich repeat domain-containing protein [Promethearchaeota archaeon]
MKCSHDLIHLYIAVYLKLKMDTLDYKRKKECFNEFYEIRRNNGLLVERDGCNPFSKKNLSLIKASLVRNPFYLLNGNKIPIKQFQSDPNVFSIIKENRGTLLFEVRKLIEDYFVERLGESKNTFSRFFTAWNRYLNKHYQEIFGIALRRGHGYLPRDFHQGKNVFEYGGLQIEIFERKIEKNLLKIDESHSISFICENNSDMDSIINLTFANKEHQDISMKLTRETFISLVETFKSFHDEIGVEQIGREFLEHEKRDKPIIGAAQSLEGHLPLEGGLKGSSSLSNEIDKEGERVDDGREKTLEKRPVPKLRLYYPSKIILPSVSGHRDEIVIGTINDVSEWNITPVPINIDQVGGRFLINAPSSNDVLVVELTHKKGKYPPITKTIHFYRLRWAIIDDFSEVDHSVLVDKKIIINKRDLAKLNGKFLIIYINNDKLDYQVDFQLKDKEGLLESFGSYHTKAYYNYEMEQVIKKVEELGVNCYLSVEIRDEMNIVSMDMVEFIVENKFKNKIMDYYDCTDSLVDIAPDDEKLLDELVTELGSLGINVSKSQISSFSRLHPRSLVGIFLDELGLDKIPETIYKFSGLKVLSLAGNNLKEIGEEICGLKDLELLNLENNDISKVHPCLLQLKNIGKINLSKNNLREVPELSKISPSLSLIDLSNNRIKKVGSSILWFVGDLKLNLSRNEIESLNDIYFNNFIKYKVDGNPFINDLSTGDSRMNFKEWIGDKQISFLRSLKDTYK